MYASSEVHGEESARAVPHTTARIESRPKARSVEEGPGRARSAAAELRFGRLMRSHVTPPPRRGASGGTPFRALAARHGAVNTIQAPALDRHGTRSLDSGAV